MHQEFATWMMLLLLLIGQSSNELPKGAGEKTTLITICEIHTAQEPGMTTCGLPATVFPGTDHLRAETLSVVPERISLMEDTETRHSTTKQCPQPFLQFFRDCIYPNSGLPSALMDSPADQSLRCRNFGDLVRFTHSSLD